MFLACLVPVRTVVEKFCHESSIAAGYELSRDALGKKGTDNARCQGYLFLVLIYQKDFQYMHDIFLQTDFKQQYLNVLYLSFATLIL